MNSLLKTTSATRLIIAAIVSAGSVAVMSGTAGAVSLRVQMACAGDYYAYCSKHPTEGPQVRQCMRANGPKLSRSCIDALIAAGEVSKAEVARRAATAN